MEDITRFILDADSKSGSESNTDSPLLKVSFSNKQTHCYSLEYLRVCAPSVDKTLVCHKKQIKLIAIEPVGKHGYRLVFDDDFSDIYNAKYLQQLHQEHESRWQKYLNEIAQSSHNRETSINFTSV